MAGLLRYSLKNNFLKSSSGMSNASSGWAGCALAHPEFGNSVNPIPTRGADYAHHITACPPGFEILAASLLLSYLQKDANKDSATYKTVKNKTKNSELLFRSSSDS